MTDEKITPPHWLNPDAILGAVDNEDHIWWVVLANAETSRVHMLRENCAHEPCCDYSWAEYLTLRPDLWPVKPELAALFGEGTE